MSDPSSRGPSSPKPSTQPPLRRTASGTLPARRPSSGEMAAVSVGQPSSGEFRTANPEGDAFRPLLELGRGGMARVYLAEKTTRGLRRLVVLKILEPTLANDAEMRALFRREAEVCARLNHPNIVQVFEVVDDAASPFMVMEYVEGVSLSQVLARTEQRLPARLHLHVLMQVLAGLHYFHELRDDQGNPLHGVHRDVSPQNVIVMHEGAVKVLDFGIAKLRDPGGADVTRTGVIKGKLSYMPPEQLIGDASIDRRADTFAVGVMLWEAFARRRMWEGWDQQAMMRALVNGNVPAIRDACPWISKRLEEIVMHAVATKREQRFETALELQVALEQAMPDLGGAVQQREVAGFMETEFGEWRRDRQRSVDIEVRRPALGLDSVLEVSEIEEIQVLSEASLEHGHVSSSLSFRPTRRRWLAPLVGVVAVACGLWLWRELGSSPAPLTGRVPASASLPSAPPSLEPARAQQAAPPSATESSSASPTEEPARDAGAAARDGKGADSAESAKRSRRAPRSSVVSAPAPRLQPSAPSPAPAPLRNCSPPYVLDAEGVKTYKPECL